MGATGAVGAAARGADRGVDAHSGDAKLSPSPAGAGDMHKLADDTVWSSSSEESSVIHTTKLASTLLAGYNQD